MERGPEIGSAKGVPMLFGLRARRPTFTAEINVLLTNFGSTERFLALRAVEGGIEAILKLLVVTFADPALLGSLIEPAAEIDGVEAFAVAAALRRSQAQSGRIDLVDGIRACIFIAV